MMKIFILFTIFIIKELNAAGIMNLPAFAAPRFSDSYLPATMQVILHAVEQLKHLQLEAPHILISSSPHPPGLTTWQIVSKIGNHMEMTTRSYKMPSDEQSKNKNSVHLKSDQKENTTSLLTNESMHTNFTSKTQESEIERKSEEIYKAVKSINKVGNEKEDTNESTIIYNLENSDENKNEEPRNSLSGQKGAELTTSSLIGNLMRYQMPLRPSLQQLAFLHDALNKDATRQGLVKYSGFSEEVIKTLSSTTKGGIGLQLKTILEKTLERNQLIREDTKIQAKKTVKDLGETNSYLSTDLRRLLPLSYTQ